MKIHIFIHISFKSLMQDFQYIKAFFKQINFEKFINLKPFVLFTL